MECRAPRQTAHETGYECARTLRQHLFGANGRPVADMRAVMQDLGWAEEPLLITDSKPASPLDAIVDHGDRGAPVVVACQHGDVRPERFRLARSLFFRHFATARERRLVTPAHTWDQRASRAFAAEFLAPAGALAKQVAGPVSFSDVDELGDEYRVSSLVIEHQIDNHQLGFVTDA